MAKDPIPIPFDENGSLLAFPMGRKIEWRENYEFDETLTVESMERGRSAARFILKDEHGRRYGMFMTDMLDLIQTAELIAYGHIDARWTFVKRGSNYGIKLVGSRG